MLHHRSQCATQRLSPVPQIICRQRPPANADASIPAVSPVRGAADHETPSTSDLAGAGDDDLLTLLHEHLSGPSPGDIDDLLRQHPERRERLEALYADYRLASRLMRGDGAALAPGRCERELGAVIAGRFTPVGVLGRGGMSIVMAAWDSRMRRKVALKCLRTREPTTAADLAGVRRRRARLVNEAQVLAQLDHPGIVPVYDIVEEAGTDEVFVAMLRVRGVDLGIARCEAPAPGDRADGGGRIAKRRLQARTRVHVSDGIRAPRRKSPAASRLPPGRCNSSTCKAP